MAYLSPCVAEDDGLGDRESVVQITECVELPILFLNGDKELLDAFQRQLITLDENADRIGHELRSHLQYVVWESGAQEYDLCCRGEVAVYVVNLVLEPLVQQLISFVKDQHLDVSCPQATSTNHVEDSSRGSRYDMLAVFEFAYVFANGRAANASVTLDVHVVPQRQNDRLNLSGELAGRGKHQCLCLSDGHIDRLKYGDGECRGLSCSGLSLSNNVASLGNGQDSTLLDSGRLFEVCGTLRAKCLTWGNSNVL